MSHAMKELGIYIWDRLQEGKSIRQIVPLVVMRTGCHEEWALQQIESVKNNPHLYTGKKRKINLWT